MQEGICLDGDKFSESNECKILDNDKEHELTSQMDRVLISIRNKSVTDTRENEDNEFMNLVTKSPGKPSPGKGDSKRSPDKFTDGYVGFSSTSSMLNKKNLRLDPEGLGESGYDNFGGKQGSEIVLLLDEENSFKGAGDLGLGKRAQPCANDLMDEGLGIDMPPKKYLVTIPVFKL